MLVIVVALLTGLHAYMVFHHPSDKNIIDLPDDEELRNFEAQLSGKSDSSFYEQHVAYAYDDVAGELFPFDPNQVSAADLKRLGMNNRLISTMLNYRKHGGKFFEAKDLKKIYGMNQALYERLVPYVIIKDVAIYPKETLPGERRYRIFKPRDINLADSASLVKIYGIGPVLSHRIVRYRNLLGGFYETGQLHEVYGFPDSVIQWVNKAYFADTATIIRLNLNEVAETEMAKHPYIGKYMARAIVSYRQKVKKINTPEELKTNGLVTASDLDRLKKYLTF